MPLLALLIAVAALCAFTYVAFTTRSLVAAGLALLDLAWIIAACSTAEHVTF